MDLMSLNLNIPDISVIICTRNRAPMLRETLQFYKEVEYEGTWELIIVDNCSTDDTKFVVAESIREIPQIRYIVEARIGLGAARDRAWREAKAPILVFTDDDCYPMPDFLTRYHECFNEREDVDFFGGKIYLWDPEDFPVTIDLREAAEDIPPYEYVPTGRIQGANMAFKKNTLTRIGGFDPSLGAGTRYPCEDIDAVAAAVWAGLRGRYDPRPLVYHHHRRRQKDLKNLFRGYDWGRGAYHMKYMLRRDSRKAHLTAWASSVLNVRTRWDVRGIVRQVSSALFYALDRGFVDRTQRKTEKSSFRNSKSFEG